MQISVVLRRSSGAALLAICCIGILHASRCAISQWTYFGLKYGPERAEELSMRMAERAYRLCPWNFHLAAWAGEYSYKRVSPATARDEDSWLQSASKWCLRSLKSNPYKRNMNVLRARLLQVESPRLAVSFWRRYVDWNYWSRYNHSLLAELLASEGRFDEAVMELDLAGDGADRAEAGKRVLDAWRIEKQAPGRGINAGVDR
jgi:hypothetical protein